MLSDDIHIKIIRILRSRFTLPEKEYIEMTKEIYSIVLNKFVDNEIERLKDCRENVIEFELSKDKLYNLINNAISSLGYITRDKVTQEEIIYSAVITTLKKYPKITLKEAFERVGGEYKKDPHNVKNQFHNFRKKTAKGILQLIKNKKAENAGITNEEAFQLIAKEKDLPISEIKAFYKLENKK
ncbi:MAG TPA: hypothetical protein PKD03_01610 [Ignavibacteriaceae bacterium]|nr:hypothetical protein [Ignavibacteriaceae bacterium]